VSVDTTLYYIRNRQHHKTQIKFSLQYHCKPEFRSGYKTVYFPEFLGSLNVLCNAGVVTWNRQKTGATPLPLNEVIS